MLNYMTPFDKLEKVTELLSENNRPLYFLFMKPKAGSCGPALREK
jgi:hypothetical protein